MIATLLRRAAIGRGHLGRAVIGNMSVARCGALAGAFASASCVASSTADCASWFSSSGKPVMTGWTLTYFPMPGAPGEVTRLLLVLSGQEWKDERMPGSKWGELKPKTKYGQMPLLNNADGKSLTQSKAMSRYLAKGVVVDGKPLYPEDAWLAFQIDEFVDAFEDVRSFLAPTFAIKDQKEKEAARAALLATDGTGKIFEGFKKIEAQIGGSDGHMIGGKLTLADVWAFASIFTLRSGFIDGVPSGWIEQLPKLKAVAETVAAQPSIKAYLGKQAQTSKVYKVYA